MKRLNDTERQQWVSNDESLYNWYRSSRLTLRQFVTLNRDDIDAHVRERLAPKCGERPSWQSRPWQGVANLNVGGVS